MIDFRCHCGESLSVPSSEAGGMLQCPRCRRLNDVPNLSEIASIQSDGGFALDTVPLAPEPDRVARVTRAFTRSKHDGSGAEIDMRPTLEEFMIIGEIPADQPPERAPTPRYDPVTGELIRGVDVKPDDLRTIAAAIPIAKPVIHYANANSISRVRFGTIAMELLKPVNLFVMGLVFVAHVLVTPMNVAMVGFIFFVAPVAIAVWMLFIAHYAIVIDETGPGELDELPRPLRDVSLSMDIWRPFWQLTAAFMFAYVPAIIALLKLPPELPLFFPVVIALTIMGAAMFPALALSTVTGGSLLNLRPDRVLGVIQKIGWTYLAAVALFAVALPLYLFGMFGLVIEIAVLFMRSSAYASFNSSRPWLLSHLVLTATLPAGIYLMHYACWVLGALYRGHHAEFPWVLQRHVSSRRDDTMKQLERNRVRNRLTAAKRAAARRNAGTPPPNQ